MKNLVQELHRIWNKGDLDAIPLVYFEEFIGHWPKGWRAGDSYGHEGVRQAINRIRNAFPDWNEEILDLIESKDRVVSRYLSTGTQHGVFDEIEPIGSRVEFEEISIYRISENKVVEQWCLADDLLCSSQLQDDKKLLTKPGPA